MPEIKLEHVTKRWAKFYAVEDLNLTIENNAFVTLLGPSGCGKTTTLRMIAGLETPTSGRITIGDKVVFDSDLGINVPANKRKVGFLFQNYALWPNMTVYQNISFGLSNVKEALPKIDFDAKNAARLAEILKTPADVVSVLDECRDKDGKLEEKKAILKLIDAFTLSQYTAKKLFDYHLEAKTDCASEIAALTAKVETAKKAAQEAALQASEKALVAQADTQEAETAPEQTKASAVFQFNPDNFEWWMLAVAAAVLLLGSGGVLLVWKTGKMKELSRDAEQDDEDSDDSDAEAETPKEDTQLLH